MLNPHCKVKCLLHKDMISKRISTNIHMTSVFLFLLDSKIYSAMFWSVCIVFHCHSRNVNLCNSFILIISLIIFFSFCSMILQPIFGNKKNNFALLFSDFKSEQFLIEHLKNCHLYVLSCYTTTIAVSKLSVA